MGNNGIGGVRKICEFGGISGCLMIQCAIPSRRASCASIIAIKTGNSSWQRIGFSEMTIRYKEFDGGMSDLSGTLQ